MEMTEFEIISLSCSQSPDVPGRSLKRFNFRWKGLQHSNSQRSLWEICDARVFIDVLVLVLEDLKVNRNAKKQRTDKDKARLPLMNDGQAQNFHWLHVALS